MKRLNLIIGKKQLVIAGLTVLLGTAVSVNFALNGAAKQDMTKPAGAAVSSDGGTAANAEASGTNYGEAEFVSSADTDAYFAQARLDKQASRDEAAEVLRSMYQGGDLTVDELGMVADDALQLSGLIESENKIETLLKAQGFEDALCYLSDDSANIIVKTSQEGLDAAGAAKIKSTLLSEYKVSSDGITIVEVN
ncbi:MAG: SpoIIIAH-like family protein [Oscillospiraceae bacterium]|nr:SpoIIIAH-like family protein [Oscillospiraceae bacterium]